MAAHKKVHKEDAVKHLWLISYADMMTVMLAMFITLSALNIDQSGQSLFLARESFISLRKSFGLGNLFATSARPVQPGSPQPHYPVWHPDNQFRSDGKVAGPAEGDPNRKVRDQEEEEFQKFLRLMEDQRHGLEKLPRVAGQASVDLYEPLNQKAPYLAPNHAQVIGSMLAQLRGRGSDYRIVVVVWAGAPTPGAMQRAAVRSKQVFDEIVATNQLDAPTRARITALGQPWQYKDLRRPILTVIVVKSEAALVDPGQ